MTTDPFMIREHIVSDASPPLFLADIGTFFNQDVALARTMIAGLKTAGCNFVKGEILDRKEICLDDEATESYFDPHRGVIVERYRELIARKVVSRETYREIFAVAKSLDMGIVLSVYDTAAADFAVDLGAVALKVASSNITHEVLIRHIASMRIPMFIDTGKSTLEEISRAYQWARDAGGRMIVVQHSPDAPPRPVTQQNLRMIPTLREALNTFAGLSDHHAGNEMMLAAVALGAVVLEKGVASDDATPDQDVTHAMRLSEVAKLLGQVTMIHQALGNRMRELARDRAKPAARMGLVARRDLVAGDLINLETADFAFPARGVGAEHWSLVCGWRVVAQVPQGMPIRFSHLCAPTDR